MYSVHLCVPEHVHVYTGHCERRGWFDGANAESAPPAAARGHPAACLSQGGRLPQENGGVLGCGAETQVPPGQRRLAAKRPLCRGNRRS